AVLRAAHAKYPDNFHVAANLGTAWQLNGDLDQPVLALQQAVRLAPDKLRRAEELHLKLVTLRRGQPKGTQSFDDLFGGKPRFDPARLPPVRADGVNPLPWAVLTATTLDRESRPTFPKHLRELDGKRVALTGFLQPIGDDPDAGAFLLIEYPVGCWFCEVPEPTGVVLVELPAGNTATMTKARVKVTGRLTLNGTDPDNFLYTVRAAAIVPPG